MDNYILVNNRMNKLLTKVYHKLLNYYIKLLQVAANLIHLLCVLLGIFGFSFCVI